MKPRHPSEDDEQIMLAQWLDAKGLLWCHVPNGGLRNKREAAKLKRMGVKPGVPDVKIYDPPPRLTRPVQVRAGSMTGVHIQLPGAAIEMKRIGGAKPTADQSTWIAALARRHWATAVCYGAAEAIRQLEEWGY
jgi:hypothetical protein